MLKFVIIAALGFILYKMVVSQKAIEEPGNDGFEQKSAAEDDTDFVEYEEVDE